MANKLFVESDGEALRTRRVKLGIDIPTLCARAGVHRNTIYRYESGLRRVDPVVLARITKTLDEIAPAVENPWQTVAQVAATLQESEQSVRGWIRNGSLKAIEGARGYRISPTSLEQFLADREVQPSASSQAIAQYDAAKSA